MNFQPFSFSAFQRLFWLAFQLFSLSAFKAGAQSIEINGPYGPPGNAQFFLFWEQLAGHSATLERSEDMVTWLPLGSYGGAPSQTEWHWNAIPEWAGANFFRTVQVPAAFAMWPANAFPQ